MQDSQINWWHEGLRVIPLIITFIILLTTMDKNIALNQDGINDNQVAIEKILTNHLPHIEAKIDVLTGSQSELLKAIYEVKALVK
jgi:hypothetical protein